MEPTYTIKLIYTIIDTVLEIVQSIRNSFHPFGSTVNQKAGQTFKALSNFILIKVDVELRSIGSPTDFITCKIYESDKTTLLATATNTILGSTIPTSPSSLIVSFNFDSLLLSKDVTYFLELSRTGSLSNINFYSIGVNTGNLYSDGDFFKFNGSIWFLVTNNDMRFEIFKKASVEQTPIDITNDIFEIASINTGLNGVYGQIKQGQALLTLKNKDSKYSPLNDTSSLFNKFRVNSKIFIQGTFNSIDYSLFTGIIDEIQPLMAFNQRNVSVRLLDIFSTFKDLTVSIGTQNGKTASELIELLLLAVPLDPSEFDIETTLEVLRDVTWDDVNLLQKLNDIVAAEQHFHFIDGDGIYIFKNNQFLSDNSPDFFYTQIDPDDAKQFFKLSEIKNKISVEYTGSLFANSEDAESILIFNSREETINNDLIKDQTDAQFIADYILDLKKDAGNFINLDLFNVFPDIFKISFGNVIELIEPFHHINNVYNVLEKTLSIPTDRNTNLKLKMRKFVFPPATQTVILEPFQDDANITIDSDSDAVLQGFKVAADAKLINLEYKFNMNISTSFTLNAVLFELNASGFPLTSLAISNINQFNTPSHAGIMRWDFSISERPTLVTTKTYGVRMFFSGGKDAFISNFTMRGKTTDVYANGKPAEHLKTPDSWVTLHPNEFYFKAELQNV